MLQYLDQRWAAPPGATLVLLPPASQNVTDPGSFWSASEHPGLTVRAPGSELTVTSRSTASSPYVVPCVADVGGANTYNALALETLVAPMQSSLISTLQMGSIHEQLGRPTPFLLRYAWVHGPAAAPGNSTAEQRHAGSLPEQQPQQQLPAPAYRLGGERGSAELHGEPAPASSCTATSRSAARDMDEGKRQAQAAPQHLAPYGSQHHAEVCFADRLHGSLLVQLHHAMSGIVTVPRMYSFLSVSSSHPTSSCAGTALGDGAVASCQCW